MSPELISILVLVVVFVIATTRSINMGALAFAAAFGVGTLVADMKADDIFKGFPGSLFDITGNKFAGKYMMQAAMTVARSKPA